MLKLLLIQKARTVSPLMDLLQAKLFFRVGQVERRVSYWITL